MFETCIRASLSCTEMKTARMCNNPFFCPLIVHFSALSRNHLGVACIKKKKKTHIGEHVRPCL